MRPPILTLDKVEDFENSIRDLIPSYLPEWKPRDGEVGWAVAKSFSQMSTQIANRLNRVPQKLFLSYLDRLEMRPKEAQSALTPIEFKLRKKGAKSARIPIKSQLMSQSKEVFETQSEFTAMRAEILSCYFVNKREDTISDIWSQLIAKKDAFLDSKGEANRHELYIRDDKLFRFQKGYGERQRVTLRIPYQEDSQKDIKWFYWEDNGELQRWIEFRKKVGKRYIYLKKKQTTPTSTTTVNGEEGYWIRATIDVVDKPISIDNFAIRLSSISGLDASFTNDVPIDLSEIFFPFGEEPKLEDSWYLASTEGFSKSGHKVKLLLDNIGLLTDGKATLSWEYNSGKSWQQLNIKYREKDVIFTIPNDINLFKHNDIESYWIRVRIVAGGYAQTTINTAQVVTKECLSSEGKTTTFEITQNALSTTYTAPTLSFNYITVKGSTEEFQTIIAYNNYNYKKHQKIPTPIFKSFEGRDRSLYLGFDNPFELGLVSLFFAVAIRQLKLTRTIKCFYEDIDSTWRKLKIEDKSQALQNSGTISFLAPSEQRASTLFATLAYWIRIDFIEDSSQTTEAKPSDSNFFDIPVGDGDQGDIIQGIYLNSVWAKYSHGGEVGANGEAHSVKKLITTIPAVKEVTNPLSIAGGAKAESNEKLIQKAPARIRHRNRGINQQDIESLVYEASADIAQAKLFSLSESGSNSVVLLPFLDEPMPKPSFLLRQQIAEYLDSRISAVSSLEVIAPEYVCINVVATLHTKEVSYADRIHEDTLSSLESYLHPLSGKINGAGWEFGESVCLSDVIGLLEHIPYVDYISNIEVIMKSANDKRVLSDSNSKSIPIPPYALIASGEHKIIVVEVER
ncbi:hypothetical protein GSY74_08770 [Sulfurovum sp. bin170]|uniref:baseplate J/gp47 family protein n=1 Tax=Sulfurovum sp. bin170 TaxID=2695268 RepID=UPI0013DF0460|nr:baseplate J/gp47 family protein [Sulfurovum sp. bin170]NEW61373.1 hypothetical protein [Sulfurovum sp. bin170]